MTALDLSRSTSGVYLTPEQSNEIWTGVVKQSAVTQLATGVKLPGSGMEYDTLGDMSAAKWVGETDEKPVDKPTIGSRIMKPFKVAKIVPVSEEFVRDKSALWSRIKEKAAQSIAQTIDQTFLTGLIPAPSSENMDTLKDAQTVSIGSGKYADFAKIATTVLTNDGDLNGIALSPHGLAKVLEATDSNDHPLLVPSQSTEIGTLFGARVVKSPWGHVPEVKADTTHNISAAKEVFGVAGDWTYAMYGTVEGIKMKISDQATINDGSRQINLWQRNMIAFLVEAEIGFIVSDKKKFAVITA